MRLLSDESGWRLDYSKMINVTLYLALWWIFHLNLLGCTSNFTKALSGSLYGLGKVSRKIRDVPFFTSFWRKKIGHWSPPSSSSPICLNIYSLWKVDKKFGQCPPPLSFGQNSKEQLLFSGGLPLLWQRLVHSGSLIGNLDSCSAHNVLFSSCCHSLSWSILLLSFLCLLCSLNWSVLSMMM